MLLYENPSIRQFVANDAFQKLQYQRQAGYLKKLGISCTSRKFCAQNTVRLFDEIHIIYSKKYANIGKIDPKKASVKLEFTRSGKTMTKRGSDSLSEWLI